VSYPVAMLAGGHLGSAAEQVRMVKSDTRTYGHELRLHAHILCRNAMMGASFQASISALFFNVLLDILVTPSKMQSLQSLSASDPLLRPSNSIETNPAQIYVGQVSALAITVTNLCIILASMMFFAVCVRLSIHTGYYYKAIAHPHSLISVEDAIKLTLETQV
jgi:hypothetical protein